MSEPHPNRIEPLGDPGHPSEEVDELRAQLDTALAAARQAELDAGVLRGELAEMRVQLARARQEQEWALTARHVRSTRWRASASATLDRARAGLARRIRR